MKLGREFVIESVFLSCASISIFAVLLIFLFIFRESLPAFRQAGFSNLFLSATWNPPAGQYGIMYFLLGTLVTTFFAMLIGAPLGIGTALFIDQVAPKKVGKYIRRGIELLAGIPSVIIGWFGLTLLVPFIARVTGSSGYGMMAASLVLVVMVLPTITALSAETLKAVPIELKEATTAMGATRWQSIYKVILPAAREGILVAVVLGMGRAIGETMAVQMVIGNARKGGLGLLSPSSTLTTRIVTEMGEAPPGVQRSALFAMALVLLILAVLLIAIIRTFAKQRGVVER